MLSFDGGLAAWGGRSVNEVSAGNGRSLYLARLYRGRRRRRWLKRWRRKRRRRTKRVRGGTGGERFLNGIVMRVFPVLSSFSNALYDCFVLLLLLHRLFLLFLPLSPLLLLYTRPLVSSPGRTPPPYSGRARILSEFVLEDFHACVNVCACVCVCNASRITRHISRLESGRNPFRPATYDLIRRPRAKEFPDPVSFPR